MHGGYCQDSPKCPIVPRRDGTLRCARPHGKVITASVKQCHSPAPPRICYNISLAAGSLTLASFIMIRNYLALGLSIVVVAPLAAQPAKKDGVPTGPISYYKNVRPIFQQHCQGCHQPAKPQGGYVMTSYPDLFKTGESELPGVVAGKPQNSLVLKLLNGQVKGRARMPKGKDPLSAQQIKTISEWIAQGATDDTPASVRANSGCRTSADLSTASSYFLSRLLARRPAVSSRGLP